MLEIWLHRATAKSLTRDIEVLLAVLARATTRDRPYKIRFFVGAGLVPALEARIKDACFHNGSDVAVALSIAPRKLAKSPSILYTLSGRFTGH